MKYFRPFEINIATVIIRFYLMMAVVITAGFSGYWFIGFLAIPIFLSIMMGVKFQRPQPTKKSTTAPDAISDEINVGKQFPQAA